VVKLAPFNFGVLIAFLLPGFTATYALSYVSPRIRQLIDSLSKGEAALGPSLLLLAISLVSGLVISAFREYVLEALHRLTGLKTTPLSHAALKDPDRFKVFQETIENRYRYSQFYGNLFLSLVLLILFRYGGTRDSSLQGGEVAPVTRHAILLLALCTKAVKLTSPAVACGASYSVPSPVYWLASDFVEHG
jgi:hypothetical protein